MASGDVVGSLVASVAPGSSRADPGVRQSASSPVENFLIIAFDDTATEYWDFEGQLEGYGGNGLTVELPWSSSTAISGQTRWGAAFRKLQDDAAGSDMDASHTYAFNTVDATAPSAAGEHVYDTITFTDGADMDNLAEGQRFRLRIQRVGGEPSGNPMSGNAQLVNLPVIRET